MRRIAVGALALAGLFASGGAPKGLGAAEPAAPPAADWTTYRGNPARTGCADDQSGPAKPKVLWTHASTPHFVASPVAAGDRLYLPALGAFNSAIFHAMLLADAPARRIAWTKSVQVFRVPSVCAPAVVGDRLILGDGMHQTDNASLLCLRSADGRVLWRLPVDGALVHIEGSPTIAGGRAYVGAGAAGVFCVDLSRVSLQGKELSIAEAEALIDRRWKELAAQYEADRKKDPDFAIPPNESSLPQPAPKVWWQQGAGAWHVDSPTAVVDKRVYVTSAYLDQEKRGERVLLCLDAEDGKTLWKAPLRYNPWGGPTVAGPRAIVPSSSIRYDPQMVEGAQGEIVALKLADGSVEWRRDAGAGVLGSAAAAGERIVFADTSGRVQALDAKTGEPRWAYRGAAPFFAGPAVSRDAVYAADLKGVVHAIALADGKPLWTLDLGAALGSPGMVYGSPLLHRGRLYAATCNIEGATAGQKTGVVCIGE
jgi:outer membrane protein assembly factor BamB